ncbi:hypothetical protein RUM44_003629 [Polyplax serrata]|uniref:Uncharacterized protein n=1 Tax=Polyplax serrata TaxID=468196 RepID=A0ABR1AH00_POLSC
MTSRIGYENSNGKSIKIQAGNELTEVGHGGREKKSNVAEEEEEEEKEMEGNKEKMKKMES